MGVVGLPLVLWLAATAGATAALAAVESAATETQAASEAARDLFEKQVRPVLAHECFPCHTGSQFGGLRLDSRAAMLKGGVSGPALVPGDPDRSLLISAVRQTGALKMPKGGKLPADQIDALVEWV